jgi:hypothetical protein
LSLELGQIGVTFWQDQISIGWGERINEKVSEGVNSAQYVVVLITDNSLRSGWVRKEVNTALHREAERGETVLLPYIFCSPDEVFSEMPDMKMKKYIDHSVPFNVAAMQIKQMVVGPISHEFIYNFPSSYVGQIWMRAAAHQKKTDMRHRFKISWGPWYREFEERLELDRDTYFTHTKLDNLSLPIRVSVDPPCRISFGIGRPPSDNFRDINPYWIDKKSRLARWFARTFLWPKI